MEDIIDECNIPFACEIVVKEEIPEPSSVMTTIVLICVCITNIKRKSHGTTGKT